MTTGWSWRLWIDDVLTLPDSLLLLFPGAVLPRGAFCPELPFLLLSGAGAHTCAAGWRDDLYDPVLYIPDRSGQTVPSAVKNMLKEKSLDFRL
jgi:hypothetical protein